ncbi:MAG: hypothetical protein QM820_03030 [Minicystis sp.]
MLEIDEHQIGPLGEGEAHAFEPVGGVDDLVPGGLEELADEQPVGGVVLDVEDARHQSAELTA